MTTLNAQQIAQIVAATIAAMNQPKAATKPSKKAPATTVDGKTERQMTTERKVVAAFKKAGYGKVTPQVDVLTYNRWLAEGFKVKPGEKSIKVGPFRLFHKKQVEYVGHSPKSEALTEAELIEFNAKQNAAFNEATPD